MFILADASLPIPRPDRFGLPAHWTVFLVLYHVTFVLHVLFMNYALGGAVICLVNDVRCLFSRDRRYLTDLNRRIFLAMPVALSFAITFGVAPLLFVQVLYGQFFYTANILIGLPWMGIIVLLTAAFYLVYVIRYDRAAPGPGRVLLRIALSGIVAVGLAAVAYLLTANAVWSITPEAWQARYDAVVLCPRPPAPHFWPRYLHNLLGAVAVACLLVAVIARALLRRRAVTEEWVSRTVRGLLVAALTLTVLQVLDGVAMLVLLRGEVRNDVMLLSAGNVHAWGWRAGVLAAVGAMLCMFRGIRQPRRALWPWLSLGLTSLTLAGMSMAREAVRAGYLRPYFQLSQWDGDTVWQYSALLMFLISFVVALGVVGWMLWVSWRIPPAAPKAPPILAAPSSEAAPPPPTADEETDAT